MELTRTEVFRAMNAMDVPSVKDCEGMLILPVASYTHSYEDQEGKEHAVLVIKDGKTGSLYKTEVQAFIKKYLSYEEVFGTLPDEEKPDFRTKSRSGDVALPVCVASRVRRSTAATGE